MRRQNFPSGARRGRVTMNRCAAGLVLSATLLSAGGALADARTEAKSHFKKGMQAIAEGKYEEGISELQRAYEILPHPNVLYNIARSYAESGDLEGAVATYRKYLEGNPPDRDEIGQVVAALESRLERQRAIAAAAASPSTPAPPATPPNVSTPGASPAPPAPAPGPRPFAAIPPGAQSPQLPLGAASSAGPPVNVGAAKTEDVFEESVVTASKGAQSPLDAPNSTSIVTEQDIRLSGITKIPELLRRLAGVDIMETTGSQTEVSLRGFNQVLSNKVIVLINGRSTFIDLLGATLWQTLPIGVEDIERIEVVRGPGSALYGADAFNGVINIITKAPGAAGERSGFSVMYGDHNAAHVSIYATGRDKEVAYRFSAGFDDLPRWSVAATDNRADLHFAPAIFGDPRSAQRSIRLNADATRDLGGGVLAGVGAGYTYATFDLGTYAPLTDQLNAADIFDGTAFLSGKHFDLHAFYQGYRGENSEEVAQIGQSLLPGQYDMNVADVEAQLIDERQLGALANNNLHIGLGYRYKDAAWTYLLDKIVENWESAYIHDELKAGKSWAFVGDIRGDYVPYLGKVVPSPKASVLFHPSAGSTIRGIVATAFRIPTFFEGYLATPAQLPVAGASVQQISTDPRIGSPKLNPEQVVTEELGYLNQDSDFFTFDSAFFHNSVNNLIEIGPNRPITVGDVANAQEPTSYVPQQNTYPLFFGGFQNQCQTYDVYGAELGLRAFPADGLDVYANYTLMGVKDNYAGCSAVELQSVVNDQRTSAHKVNAGVQFRTKLGIDGSVDFHYVSSQDWGLPVTNVAAQKIENALLHLDAYTLVNARLGYRFLHDQAEISGVAFNLLNDKHREHPFGELVGQRFMGMFSYRF